MRELEDTVPFLLILAVSLAFSWLLWPFYGAILWGIVAAIVFAPLHRKILGPMRQHPNLAAAATVLIIVLIVILPLMLVGTFLLKDASSVYDRVQSGELDLVRLFQKGRDILPVWLVNMMHRFDVSSLGAVQQQLSAGIMASRPFFAGQALNIGQSTFGYIINLGVMLYLLFFLLRDEASLSKRIRSAIPLRDGQKDILFRKFAVVIRATVKGDILVALLQGALGGLIFWILGISSPLFWAALMAFLSLLPLVGAALVWLPVALYLFAAGSVWQGVVLILFGTLVISLIDNILRPALVGKDTKMPEYVVLISTLGGIEMFGLHGFVVGPVIAAMFIAAWEMFLVSRARTVDPH